MRAVGPSVPIPSPFPKRGEGVPEAPLHPWRWVGVRMPALSVNGYRDYSLNSLLHGLPDGLRCQK